jgi:hypothetical protein
MTNKVVGNQTTKPIMKGCTGHKATTVFQSENQQSSQKQYFALGRSFSTKRKSIHALSTKLTPLTLSLASVTSAEKGEFLNYGVYSDARNIPKNREFMNPQYHWVSPKRQRFWQFAKI